MTTDITDTFLSQISNLDHSKTTAEKFHDFCELAYCSLAKVTADEDKGQQLENRYMEIVGTYRDKDTIRAYPELLSHINQGVWHGQDALGVIAAELNVLDEKQGQFFTPMHVCELMAMMTLTDAKQIIGDQGFITVSDPCAGAGAMFIANADQLHRQGFDPERHMLAHGIELNRLSYQMAFIQLSLKGIPAYVEHGNSLSLECFDGAWTPSTLYFHHVNGCLFPEGKEPETGTPEPPTCPEALNQQFDLFNNQN